MGLQRKHSASRTSLRASKDLGLPLPLTREPPRRRRIGDTVTTDTPYHPHRRHECYPGRLLFAAGRDQLSHRLRSLQQSRARPRRPKQRRELMYRRRRPADAAGRNYGRRRCDDGAMYLGDFADDCLTRAWLGACLRSTDTRHHGEFRDGKPNGYGEMRYASGASHRGLWEKGERNGSGVFVDVDGSVIETLWKGDLPETAE